MTSQPGDHHELSNDVAGSFSVERLGDDSGAAAHIAPLGGDFTVFGGLFRRVFLLATGDVHVDALDHGGPGVYVSTDMVSTEMPGPDARLLVNTRVRNDRPQPIDILLRTTVVDADGAAVAREQSRVHLPPDGVTTVSQRARIEQPHVWSGRF